MTPSNAARSTLNGNWRAGHHRLPPRVPQEQVNRSHRLSGRQPSGHGDGLGEALNGPRRNRAARGIRTPARVWDVSVVANGHLRGVNSRGQRITEKSPVGKPIPSERRGQPLHRPGNKTAGLRGEVHLPSVDRHRDRRVVVPSLAGFPSLIRPSDAEEDVLAGRCFIALGRLGEANRTYGRIVGTDRATRWSFNGVQVALKGSCENRYARHRDGQHSHQSADSESTWMRHHDHSDLPPITCCGRGDAS